MSKIKNILIFVAIGIGLILIYIYFIKPAPEQNGLVSITPGGSSGVTTATTDGQDSLGTKDFLLVLLSVKNIKLDDTIFSDAAFSTLHDSSIILTPDGTEGRINPFAPIGSDRTTTPVNNPNTGGTNPQSGGAPANTTPLVPPKTN